MPDYANGKVYVIRNRAAGDGVVYVGSTTQALCERMNQHRRDMKRHPDWKLYKLMADVGVQHFHVELLADFRCERREQLMAEEGRHIRALRPECNTIIAGRTAKEWRSDRREANPGVDAARSKAWADANPACQASYRAAHRDVAAARSAAWFIANHDAALATAKANHARKKANATPEEAAALVAAAAARSKASYERKKAARLAATAAVDAVTAGVAGAAIV